MPLTKPFAIGTEGPTVDGRHISRQQLQEMAAHYDPKAYTAVANLEHLLGLTADSIFPALGKVVSLSTQETDILGEKKLQLFAVVDASQQAVDMQKSGKKSFASMEVTPNFIGAGKAYLTGLAFTDTPASLGTEPMRFSAQSGKDNRYSFSQEISIEWEPSKPETRSEDDAGTGLFAKVKELLTGKSKADDARLADQAEAIEAIALSQKDALDQIGAFKAAQDELKTKLAALADVVAGARQEFTALKTTLDHTPKDPPRPEASGGNGAITTDC